MTVIAKIDNVGHKLIRFGKHTIDIYAILANFSTISNLLLGLYAFLAILFSDTFYTDHYIIARGIVLGASFDAIDGKLARRSHTKPRLGAQFDTAADLFTFCLAPGAMVLSIFYPISPFIGYLLGLMVMFFASFRLSRFMIDPTTARAGYFKGMPSPVAALFVTGVFVIDQLNLPLAAFGLMFISAEMITSYPFTAMKQVKTWFQKINFIFTVSIMLLFTYAPDTWMQTLGYLWIIQVLYFGILGPTHAYRTLEVVD